MRYNIVYAKDAFYWPQETIRHCRTGRIKRGMILKRQFGVYYPDKTRDLVALKIMEKVCYGVENELQSAISESFQWNEDDVQTELGVMKELSENGGHENVLFLHDINGVRALMKGHRAILEPKFRLCELMLEENVGDLGVAEWNKPNGGYFISVDVLDGCAKRVVQLCKEAGVILTDAGATFPYGKDPHDSNIRLAPSFPPLEELEQAMEVFCCSIKLAAAEKLLNA